MVGPEIDYKVKDNNFLPWKESEVMGIKVGAKHLSLCYKLCFTTNSRHSNATLARQRVGSFKAVRQLWCAVHSKLGNKLHSVSLRRSR